MEWGWFMKEIGMEKARRWNRKNGCKKSGIGDFFPHCHWRNDANWSIYVVIPFFAKLLKRQKGRIKLRKLWKSMEKLWKAGFLYSLLISLFLPFKSTEKTWKYQLPSHHLRSSPSINYVTSWKKYGIIVEKAHHFLSSGSMDSSSKSLHFHSFFRRVLIIPFGIFFSASMVHLFVELLLVLI